MTSRRPSPLVLGLAGLVLLVGLGAAAGLAYLFLRGPPPPAVGLGSPSPTRSQPASSGSSLPVASGTTGPVSTGAAAGLDGTWTVDTAIGSFGDFSSSFVGYRVNETFANNKANTAVGRTPAVSGTLTLAGATITSVEVTADLSQLKSDDGRRDGRLQEQAIETDRFPTATFHLGAPIDLGAIPTDGATIDASAIGELTLHGVTRQVTVPIQARLSGGVVSVTGSLDIAFADYSIEKPTSFVVLSIEDHGVMELQLHFQRA